MVSGAAPQRSIIQNHHDVFETYAPLTVEVDAWFNTERVTNSDDLVVASYDIGLLVNFGADAMTGAVDEIVTKSRVGDH